jgi:hypothetical protein
VPNSPFNCVSDAYDTGSVLPAGLPWVEYCTFAAAGAVVGAALGPDWPRQAVLNTKDKPSERSGLRFIFRGGGVRENSILQARPYRRSSSHFAKSHPHTEMSS